MYQPFLTGYVLTYLVGKPMDWNHLADNTPRIIVELLDVLYATLALIIVVVKNYIRI